MTLTRKESRRLRFKSQFSKSHFDRAQFVDRDGSLPQCEVVANRFADDAERFVNQRKVGIPAVLLDARGA